jgi:hypothetical protein
VTRQGMAVSARALAACTDGVDVVRVASEFGAEPDHVRGDDKVKDIISTEGTRER